MTTKIKSANVDQVNKAKELKKVNAGANFKNDLFAYARKKDGEISTFKLKQAAAKEMSTERDSISGAIKTLNDFSGKKLDLMLEYGKLERKDILAPSFYFKYYESVVNCFFVNEDGKKIAWYKFTTLKDGQKLHGSKERTKWSANFLLTIIEAAIK